MMTIYKKRQIHKALCIILFSIMTISALLNVLNVNLWQNETFDKAVRTIGIVAETPFLILLIKYLFDYRRVRKGNQYK